MAIDDRREMLRRSAFPFVEKVRGLFEKEKVLLKRSMALILSQSPLRNVSMDVVRTHSRLLQRWFSLMSSTSLLFEKEKVLLRRSMALARSKIARSTTSMDVSSSNAAINTY
ncbi:MAG TPA: hypothetical protein VGQ46_11180 [Thermoanaerobaculia bacterium]|nr:hypothetical protein [Thermoanaerobaculia bacterium]